MWGQVTARAAAAANMQNTMQLWNHCMVDYTNLRFEAQLKVAAVRTSLSLKTAGYLQCTCAGFRCVKAVVTKLGR